MGNPADDVDVVVVGAGWAGMASADHLRKAEVSFVVLEAQSHTGGRRHAFMFGHESVDQMAEAASTSSVRFNEVCVVVGVSPMCLGPRVSSLSFEGSRCIACEMRG